MLLRMTAVYVSFCLVRGFTFPRFHGCALASTRAPSTADRIGHATAVPVPTATCRKNLRRVSRLRLERSRELDPQDAEKPRNMRAFAPLPTAAPRAFTS